MFQAVRDGFVKWHRSRSPPREDLMVLPFEATGWCFLVIAFPYGTIAHGVYIEIWLCARKAIGKVPQRDQSLWLSQPSLRIPTFPGTMGAESGVICAPLSARFAPTHGSLLLNPYPSVSGTRLFRAPIYFGYLSLIFPSVSKRVLKSTNNRRFFFTPPRLRVCLFLE